MSIENYLENVKEESIKERLESLKDSNAVFTRRYRIIDLSAIPFWESSINFQELNSLLETPYKKDYEDGIELWLGWLFRKTIAVFGIYDLKNDILHEYWLGMDQI